jgi:hypothetical protein
MFPGILEGTLEDWDGIVMLMGCMIKGLAFSDAGDIYCRGSLRLHSIS